MSVESQPAASLGVVRVARQVLTSIVINTTLQLPGVLRMASSTEQWNRFLGREVPKQGVHLQVKNNTVTADLYIVVSNGSNIVEVGTAIQEEVAAAIENMIGLQVHEVNVYIQNVE